MLNNYLKTAWRALRRRPGYTAINVIGLVVGITSCLLILLYVRHELSYDAFHEHADRLFRVVAQDTTGERNAVMQGPMGPTMARDFAEVDKAVRLHERDRTLVTYGKKRFYKEGGLRADPAFFEIFTFPLTRGNPQTALRTSDAIVLTASTAEKFFGDQNPMGRTLTLGTEEERTVTGVAQNVPSNSHFSFDYVVPMPDSLFGAPLSQWNTVSAFASFALLEDSQVQASLEEKLPAFTESYLGEKRASAQTFTLQPLRDIYLSDG